MINDERIKELIIKAQGGCNNSKELIIENNINLVRSIVHRFMNRGYEWDDLFQIGCIGLMKAVDRFNADFNVKFSTYAVPMIIGEIRRFIRDDNPVKISRPIKELAYKIHRTQESLQGKLGREPTINEVSSELSLSPQEVVAALEAIQTPTSIYEQTYHDDGNPINLVDHLRYDDKDANSFFDSLALKEVISKLPAKEKKVIELRFYEDRTQAEIAKVLDLSQVQISRIEKHALILIRKMMEGSNM